MVVLQWTYLTAGGAVCLYLALFAVSSIRERRPRAVVVSLLLLFGYAGAWYGWFLLIAANSVLLALPLAGFGLLLTLFLLPTNRCRKLDSPSPTEFVDERDTMFAREEYEPGTSRYDQYYSEHPQYQEIDDRLRELPQLLAPGGRYYHEERSRKIRDTFGQIRKLTTKVDGDISATRVNIEPDKATTEIKRLVCEMGADEVGVARLNPMFVYSHVGRGPEPWGSPIETVHKFAVAFTLEMDYACVEDAPDLPITEETARRYHQAARISVALAQHIRSMGYPARAHISDSNYQIMLPPVAQDAGLGEIGRLGYLISPRFGPRVRLGGVTTDLPLIPDKPVSHGMLDFCVKCVKCATNCPSAAIPNGVTSDVLGVDKWPLQVEQCMRYWRLVGTDCGICMKVCPYSHPPTLVHNFVRVGIRRSSFAQTVSVWGDDLFYGRKAAYPAI